MVKKIPPLVTTTVCVVVCGDEPLELTVSAFELSGQHGPGQLCLVDLNYWENEVCFIHAMVIAERECISLSASLGPKYCSYRKLG